MRLLKLNVYPVELWRDSDNHPADDDTKRTFYNYSRARLIRMANARKNRANYPSMQIIRAYFMLRFYQWQRVVARANVWIKQGMRISEGQIIRAILYMASLVFMSNGPITQKISSTPVHFKRWIKWSSLTRALICWYCHENCHLSARN